MRCLIAWFVLIVGIGLYLDDPSQTSHMLAKWLNWKDDDTVYLWLRGEKRPPPPISQDLANLLALHARCRDFKEESMRYVDQKIAKGDIREILRWDYYASINCDHLMR